MSYNNTVSLALRRGDC